MKSIEREIVIEYIRASGPGGQNVNKVSSAAQLRFDILNSPSLPPYAKMRLIKLAGKRVTNDGILVIEARRHRAQEQNRADALRRFQDLLQKALEKPKQRKETMPTRASKEKRLAAKKHRGEVKRIRQDKSFEA
jgi:ribosome-associated protein